MVATPFKTFTKVHIIQQPIHLTLSQKYRKRLFLLGPRHFPQRIYRNLASPQKEFIVCPDRTQLSVYRIRSKSFVHQGSNPFTNKFRIYIRWSQVSQHFFSKPLQFKNILLVICIVVGAMKGKDCLGMDFTGGSSISYLVNKGDVSVKEAEDVVNKLALTQKATVQEVAESTDSSKVNILVNFSDNAQDKTEITSALKKSFPVLDNAPFSEETIGQSMGYDTLITSAWALFFGILGIMIYLTVRFEWTFAIGAVIALTHDVLLVLGLVIISGTELNVIHIGALLTVAGYSINDKIIVFDRIREYIRYADPNDSAEQIMNEAINQTLSRTLLTSLSTLAVLVCLYFFGGPSMEDFAWTISAGILIGTYSSIFIASPAALLFSKKHGLHAEVKQAMKAGA